MERFREIFSSKKMKENLKRIARYIVKKTGKNTFEPGELEPFYDLIAPNIKSKYGP